MNNKDGLIMQFFFICPNASFSTHYFIFNVNNMYVSNMQCFFNSYLYKRLADIL